MGQINLTKKEDSKRFYETRYLNNYMFDWPIQKKNKIIEVIKSLELPINGEALDFGCGNGVFSQLLKEILPDWNVYGCDISEVAVNNAMKRFPNCIFFSVDDDILLTKKFDFVFTHHVLEHVFDIKVLAEQMNNRLNESSSMLHILPCGNINSFEYRICSLRSDGIDYSKGNRFFYEDEGHLRRMTTDQLTSIFSGYNFKLKNDYYSNQYDGAVDWITQTSPLLIFKMFNPFKGKDYRSKFILFMLLMKMGFISLFRIIPKLYYFFSKANKLNKKYLFPLILIYLPYKLFVPIESYFEKKTKTEWDKCKTDRQGSEMFLYYVR